MKVYGVEWHLGVFDHGMDPTLVLLGMFRVKAY